MVLSDILVFFENKAALFPYLVCACNYFSKKTRLA